MSLKLKHIVVSEENFQKPKNLGRAGDSFNDVISKLLEVKNWSWRYLLEVGYDCKIFFWLLWTMLWERSLLWDYIQSRNQVVCMQWLSEPRRILWWNQRKGENTALNEIKNNLHDTGMNPSFNDLLTMYSNERLGWHPTKKEFALLKSCYDINTVLGELFSRLDLGQFDRTFRYYVWKLGDIFEKIIDSRPPFFKLRGLHVSNQTIKDTKVRKVKPDFDHILSRLKHQPPHIHDIKLSTRTDGLYSGLLSTNHIPNCQNHQITIRDFPIMSKFKTTATVSKNGNLTLHIGCTYNPISYSISGFDLLIQYLSQVEFILQARSGGKSFSFQFINGLLLTIILTRMGW